MTEPTPAPPEQGHAATIVATAALALALIAVEARIRQEVEQDIRDALLIFAALLLIVLLTPAIILITGVQLMSQPRVHSGLLTVLNAAKAKVKTSIASGYTAASRIAATKIAADLQAAGYPTPDALPTLDNTLDILAQDIDTMFGHAQSDIQNSIIAAFDGVQGDNPDDARTVVIRKALDAAQARLQQRAAAAAGTAVQQGSRDTQQALYDQHQNTSGQRGLMKRWTVTSNNPCGMCLALNGTLVGVTAEFDHQATTVDKDLRPVWRNLLGPPRHPNCRCQLELVTT